MSSQFKHKLLTMMMMMMMIMVVVVVVVVVVVLVVVTKTNQFILIGLPTLVYCRQIIKYIVNTWKYDKKKNW
jgi:predicted RND superfamily exporter protein